MFERTKKNYTIQCMCACVWKFVRSFARSLDCWSKILWTIYTCVCTVIPTVCVCSLSSHSFRLWSPLGFSTNMKLQMALLPRTIHSLCDKMLKMHFIQIKDRDDDMNHRKIIDKSTLNIFPEWIFIFKCFNTSWEMEKND